MSTATHSVLSERLWATEAHGLWIKRAILLIVGVAVLTIAAKIRVPLWPSPVPVTLGTFAVLSIGAAYGPRLGLGTIIAYMAIGAMGFDVFASSSAENNGIAYMLGGSGGYLLGYVLATFALGLLARRGWDRSVASMSVAMIVGNALIYIPGLLWLATWINSNGYFDAATYASVFEQTMVWGLTPFIIGDILKLAVAAMIFPMIWKLVGKARG